MDFWQLFTTCRSQKNKVYGYIHSKAIMLNYISLWAVFQPLPPSQNSDGLRGTSLLFFSKGRLGSMGLVYLPTFTIKKKLNVGMLFLTMHGSYGKFTWMLEHYFWRFTRRKIDMEPKKSSFWKGNSSEPTSMIVFHVIKFLLCICSSLTGSNLCSSRELDFCMVGPKHCRLNN